MIRAALVFLMLAGTYGMAKWIEARPADHLLHPIDSFSPQLAGWSASGDLPISTRAVGRLAPTEYLSRKYSHGGLDAGLFIAYYSEQKAGESMHSPRYCLPGAGWEIVRHDAAHVRFRGKDVPINHYWVQNGAKRLQVIYWYQSGSRIVANEYYGKVALLKDALLLGQRSGSMVRISLADQPGVLDNVAGLASAAMDEMARCMGD